MSETLQSSPETGRERLPKAERLLPTAEQAEPLRKNEVDPRIQAAEARQEIALTAEKAASPLDRLKAAEAADKPVQPLNINRELKAITLNRELRTIQRKLTTPQRALSKLVHQPLIRAISEAADSTISRPSGLLGGGLAAFLGTSAYLYLTKAHGYDYNYFISFALFAGGFIVGLGLEMLVHLLTSSHRHSSD